MAVQNAHLQQNIEPPVSSFKRLKYLLRCIKRYQGKSQYVQKPITVQQLNSLINHLQPFSTSNPDGKMLRAAICLALFGIMRISEFTCNGAYDPTQNLSLEDGTFSPSSSSPCCMKVVLKPSKSDPFR